ncbi:MAG TPA: MmcQ/YjbR family DNA-binding protein [Polyangiaceae bacterium]|nr:MmcQ/YjbR family DNA-binding protein [Polyangiaceae bacterium]
MPRTKRSTDALLKELREFGLAYPGAHTKSPWPGHLDLAVNDKTFAFLSIEGEPFSISCKLPQSNALALTLPFAKPTGYGLGKSGWVSAQFPEGKMLPKDLLKEWIDESYRAQAPKKLVASLAASTRVDEGTAKSRPKSSSSSTAKRARRTAGKGVMGTPPRSKGRSSSG